MRPRYWPITIALFSAAIAAPGCRRSASGPETVTSVGGVAELIAHNVVRDGEKTTFRLSFRCTKTMDRDFLLMFHGHVRDELLLPPARRSHKFLNADRKFRTPTSTWKVDDTITQDVTLALKAGQYNFRLGLCEMAAPFGALPGIIDLGWMDLPPK